MHRCYPVSAGTNRGRCYRLSGQRSAIYIYKSGTPKASNGGVAQMVERSLRTEFHTVKYETAIGTGIDAPHLQPFRLAAHGRRLQSKRTRAFSHHIVVYAGRSWRFYLVCKPCASISACVHHASTRANQTRTSWHHGTTWDAHMQCANRSIIVRQRIMAARVLRPCVRGACTE